MGKEDLYAPEDFHPENSGIYIQTGDERINVGPEDALNYGWSSFTLLDNLVLVNTGTLNYCHKIITTELDRVEEWTRVRMATTTPAEELTVPSLRNLFKYRLTLGG